MSQFSFLAGEWNSFQTLPPLSELLPRVSRSVSTFGYVSPVVDSNSVITVILIGTDFDKLYGRQNAFSV